jgi:hypothetical protein
MLYPSFVRRIALLSLPVSMLCAATVQPLRAQSEGASQSAGSVIDFVAVQRSKVYSATRASGRIVIDGIVDEPTWERAAVGTDFYQTDPQSGVPATERTEFRVLYDEDQIYLSVVAHQSDPTIISELKREFAATDGDVIIVFFDTFDDDRNGFAFATNPGSAMRDWQISGGSPNENWDGVYEVAAQITDLGWTAEFAIPFKTLRFDDTTDTQSWGFNIQRIMRNRNEWVQWSPAPRPFRIFEASIAGTLEGIEGVRQGSNLKVKPFLVANRQESGLPVPGQESFDGGIDLKYGITSGLTLDLTVNTDFSQVEVDQQQVNLSRFGLFFPEKREFFLENLGVFDVCGNAGGGGGRGGRGGGRGGGGRCGAERDIVPFFSRRIGLSEDGQPLSMRGGARVTGKLAGFDVGVLGLNVGGEDDAPDNNWMVGRLRHDVLANSQAGAFLFYRKASVEGDWNRTVGIDGNFNFFQQRLNLSGAFLRAETPTTSGDNLATTMQVTYRDRIFNASSAFVSIGDDFHNDFGFTPRLGIRKFVNNFGVTPRFSGPILEDNPRLVFRQTLDSSNRLVTSFNALGNSVTFRDGANFTMFRNWLFERLDEPFEIRGQTIPVGDYHFNEWNFRYSSSRARRVNVSAGYRAGGFFDGNKKEISGGIGLNLSAGFQASADWGRNIVGFADGGFTTDLIGVRAAAAFSPKMFLEAFVQYNTAAETVSSNVRYRFIHHPLSDFFVVYSELRPTEGDDETLRNVSLKLTHLLNF